MTLDGDSFEYATFGPESADLPQVICLIGDLKSAVIVVRGRLYPAGKHTHLYRWLVCFQRMQAMQLPASACSYKVGALHLSCSLLGSLHAHERESIVDPESFYALAAARDGLDRCPRFKP